MTSAAKTILEGKADMTLLPYEGLCAAVGGFEDGIRPDKYERNDWRKGMPWSVPVAAILRHSSRIAGGELIDPDSGRPHSEHIAARALMLAHYVATGTGVNDLTDEGKDMATGEYNVEAEDFEEVMRSVDFARTKGQLTNGMTITTPNGNCYYFVKGVGNDYRVERMPTSKIGFTRPKAPAVPQPLTYRKGLFEMMSDYVTRSMRTILGGR
jgi:hypothetical protein